MKMKIILLILGVIAILFILSQLYFMSSQRNIEQYSFEVLETYDEIEIRQYEASLVTSVQLSSNDYKKSSSKGFSILAGYIFGGNDKNEKIAMTSPVAMTLKDKTTMMFLVPKKYSKENLPTPKTNIDNSIVDETNTYQLDNEHSLVLKNIGNTYLLETVGAAPWSVFTYAFSRNANEQDASSETALFFAKNRYRFFCNKF